MIVSGADRGADSGAGTPSDGRRRASSVRLRTTAGAVLVVGLALLSGSIGVVTLLDRTLVGDVRGAALAQADEVVVSLEAGGAPGTLGVGDVEEQLIQVLDGDGAVVASSANVSGRGAVADLPPGEETELDGLLEPAPFLVVSAAASTDDGGYTVLVARSLSDASEAVVAVRNLLAVGVPVLLLVVPGTTWRVVGRALRPVAAIRAEVEQISGAQLHRRVPQPAGDDEIADLARTMNGMLARLDDAAARQR
ncbi:MAG: HAMP domain-containing protein, partial [Geodermatophilaceae bacterium]|nr:HAMP domain-containing protein [Geodermatophilaceae bacterium]